MDPADELLPVWTLADAAVEVPHAFDARELTPERIAALRAVLAAQSDEPAATLEAHPCPVGLDRSRGIAVDAATPLARGMSTILAQSPKALTGALETAPSGEVLYRMVLPAKFADQVGKGLVRSMRSRTVSGGIRDALVDARGIAGHASFVPAVGTTATASGGLIVGGIAAGPVILLVAAVGLSAYADQQQQQAIEELSTLLKKLDKHNLDTERQKLMGCHDAIETATALILDGAEIGHSIGFDSAVGDINTAVAAARDRLGGWSRALKVVPRTREGRVEIHRIIEVLPGIDQLGGGEFRAHLELAALAIALKRRVIILQALEHAQLNPDNPFARFTQRMRRAGASVDELEDGIRALLVNVASLDVTAPSRWSDQLFKRGDVDEYLRAMHTVQALAAAVDRVQDRSDVAIELIRDNDGKLTVLPAIPA